MIRSRWAVLALIWAVFLVHGIDRSVILVLLEAIRRDFTLSDSQVGLIAGLAYAVPFALAGIPLGALADRVNRARYLGILLALWSSLTALAGLAPSFLALLVARAGVGASESGAPPTMLSILGDRFDDRSRPAALSFYYTAPFVGLMAGSVVAGQIAQHHGWRMALLAVGLPGIVLALVLFLCLRDPPRSASGEGRVPVGIGKALGFAWRDRQLRRLIAALVLGGFVTLAIAAWTPLFLQRAHGFSQAQTGWLTALSLGLGGGAGSLVGGWIANCFGRGEAARLRWLCGYALLLATPAVIIAPLLPSAPLAVALLALWSFIGSAYLGPGWGLCIAACPPDMRGTVLGAVLVLSNLVSAGLGPQLVGWLSDLLAWGGDTEHLSHALSATALFAIAAAALFLLPVTDAGRA